ncbi:hypothetical protein [Yinghuangia soli]|uniref:DUF3291 domain-containing protein n=1 Tax=Yinghuangia soli TaxID=2908204 RepID=A0AA41TY73_9ACTN|nr:hypothetical protein [Yinghuangia soli]MCF2527548.1 hypothetical protein [Yinghuangia soli]
MAILRTGWQAGAAAADAGDVLVSVTDFTAQRHTALPGIARAGFRLRRVWPELDGAVGVWLWTLPAARRAGSVAVWRDARAMHGFVGLPEHVAIMRRYRSRGSARTANWADTWAGGTDPAADLARIWQAAAADLAAAR